MAGLGINGISPRPDRPSAVFFPLPERPFASAGASAKERTPVTAASAWEQGKRAAHLAAGSFYTIVVSSLNVVQGIKDLGALAEILSNSKRRSALLSEVRKGIAPYLTREHIVEGLAIAAGAGLAMALTSAWMGKLGKVTRLAKGFGKSAEELNAIAKMNRTAEDTAIFSRLNNKAGVLARGMEETDAVSRGLLRRISGTLRTRYTGAIADLRGDAQNLWQSNKNLFRRLSGGGDGFNGPGGLEGAFANGTVSARSGLAKIGGIAKAEKTINAKALNILSEAQQDAGLAPIEISFFGVRGMTDSIGKSRLIKPGEIIVLPDKTTIKITRPTVLRDRFGIEWAQVEERDNGYGLLGNRLGVNQHDPVSARRFYKPLIEKDRPIFATSSELRDEWTIHSHLSERTVGEIEKLYPHPNRAAEFERLIGELPEEGRAARKAELIAGDEKRRSELYKFVNDDYDRVKEEGYKLSYWKEEGPLNLKKQTKFDLNYHPEIFEVDEASLPGIIPARANETVLTRDGIVTLLKNTKPRPALQQQFTLPITLGDEFAFGTEGYSYRLVNAVGKNPKTPQAFIFGRFLDGFDTGNRFKLGHMQKLPVYEDGVSMQIRLSGTPSIHVEFTSKFYNEILRQAAD